MMSMHSLFRSGKSGLLVLLTLVVCAVSPDAFAATVTVSGGGTALRSAVSAASVGDTIQVTDSSNYDCFTLDKALTIEVADGQAPKVIAGPAGGVTVGGEAIRINADGRGSVLKGLHLIRDSAENVSPGNSVLLLCQGAEDEVVFTMYDCIVEIAVPDVVVDNRVCDVYDTVYLYNCTFRRSDRGANACLRFFDASGNSHIEKCTIGPAYDGTITVCTLNPTNQTVNFTECTFIENIDNKSNFGLGLYDRQVIVNLDRCNFGGNTGIYGGNPASASGTIVNSNRCIFGPRGDGGRRVLFAADGSGATYNYTNCVFFSNKQNNESMTGEGQANTYRFIHCTFSDAPGQKTMDNMEWLLLGRGFTDNIDRGTYEFKNSIVNLPNTSNVSVLATRGESYGMITVDAGVNMFNVLSAAADDSLRGAAGGTELIADPLLLDDKIHLASASPAQNVGADLGITVDYDGEIRPQGDPKPDLGADETGSTSNVEFWTQY